MTSTIHHVAEAPAATVAPPDTQAGTARRRRDAFIRLSVELTGFDEYTLRGTGQVEAHLATVDGQVGAAYLDTLLGVGDAPSRVRTAVLGAIAQLWYAGAWLALPDDVYADLNALAGGQLAPNGTFIPSYEAYLQGLVWRAFEGHPMGGKPPGFGSWSQPPAVHS